MKPLLFLVQPLNLATGARVDIRLSSVPSPIFAGLGDLVWEGAVSRRPRFMLDMMSPDLDGKFQAGRGDFMVNLNHVLAVASPEALHWSGAPVTVYDASSADYANMPIEFTGIVAKPSLDIWTKQIVLNLEVEKIKLDRPLLTLEFDGSGGAGGQADKRGTLKPAGFGFNENCEPVWFDDVNNVGMLDGYGNLTTVHGLFEGGNDLDASFGNYASYAALIAAPIPKGRWATCIAEGLVRLGAPPAGRISCDATFRGIAGTGANLPGALLRRILETHCGIAVGSIDTASFASLDVTVPRLVHYWTASQRGCLDLIEALSASCNATTLILLSGKIVVTRAFGGAVIGTADRLGSTYPIVTDWQISDPEEPLWRMRARGCRPGTVFSYEEIFYEDDLEDRGAYQAAETYRQGHLVWMPDGSQWLYKFATPTAGNSPPASPATSNTYWQRTRAPTTAADLVYGDGTPIESLKPGMAGATKNRTWEQGADPALVPANAVVNGDVWIDNSVVPKVTKERVGGAWVFGANLVQSGPDIGVAAGATSDLTLIPGGETTKIAVSGNRIVQAAASAASWNIWAYSNRAQIGTAELSWRASATGTGTCLVGLVTPSNKNVTGYSSMSYGMWLNGSLLNYVEGAAYGSLAVTAAVTDALMITYDGAYIRYHNKESILREVLVGPNLVFHPKVMFDQGTSLLVDLAFGSLTDRSWTGIVGPDKPENNATRNVVRGVWLAATAYVVGDIVQYASGSWHCATAHTSNASFPPGHASNTQFISLAIQGNWRDTMFMRSPGRPATPTGSSPAGWSNSTPDGTDSLWQIWALKKYDGTLLTDWSIPNRITGLAPRGAYAAGTTYYLNETVTYNGGSYLATQNNFSNQAPSGTGQSNSYWDVLSAPGATGAPATPPGAFSTTIAIGAQTGTVNLRSLANAAGYTGNGAATITFNVTGNVTALAGGRAIDTGTWPSASYAIALTLNVQAGVTVAGGGGIGGDASYGAGGIGGDAIYCQEALTITNAGAIRAGGGGGGGGRGQQVTPPGQLPSFGDPYNGGGGGGGGSPNGTGGTAEAGDGGGTSGANGSVGTTSGGGAGGAGSVAGGGGGGYGAAGTASAGAAGVAGYAVRKNGKVVTNALGTYSGTWA